MLCDLSYDSKKPQDRHYIQIVSLNVTMNATIWDTHQKISLEVSEKESL